MNLSSLRYQHIVIAILVVIALATISFMLFVQLYGSSQPVDARSYGSPIVEKAELEQMLTEKAVHKDYEEYFQAIAEEKGAPYAFDLMKTAPLPFGMDTHLLGHAIGDILYAQEGVDGMKFCTHDFRNACSHTIVIGALLEYGTDVKDLIREACKQAPGGTGAYTMCYHGLGHGVLAFNGYDLEKTSEMCRIFGTEVYKDEESSQCFGGAVMEIIGGGGHDRELWEVERERNLIAAEPLEICDREYLTEGQRRFCYVYITPFLLESVGADQGRPNPSDFASVFDICIGINKEHPELRSECFGGLGKEFIGIVAGRDFRDGIKITDEGYKTMQDWCSLAKDLDGIISCQSSVTGSLYWGGENDIALPLSFCAQSPADTRANCYGTLIDNVNRYVQDTAYRENACSLFPEDFVASCKEKLLQDVIE